MPTSRFRRCTARRSCAFRGGHPATAPCSGSAAKARRRSPAGKNRGDIHYRFVIDVPEGPHARAAEALEGLSKAITATRATRCCATRSRVMARTANRASPPGRRGSGVFMISVAAELAEMHPQTLRMYETRGLITPQRSPKGTRLYSQEDVERLRRIQEMTCRAGHEPRGRRAGVRARGQAPPHAAASRALEKPKAETLADEMDAELEEVRRSVGAEIVRYEAPGMALVPVRRAAARGAGSTRTTNRKRIGAPVIAHQRPQPRL